MVTSEKIQKGGHLCRSLPEELLGEIVTDDQMGGGGVREVVSAGVHDTYK
jgi:hypothetical protein